MTIAVGAAGSARNRSLREAAMTAEVDRFLARVVDIALHPDARMLVWGVSDVSARALAQLRGLGLEDAVVDVVDHRPERQGLKVSGWTVRAPIDVASWQVGHLVIGLDAEKEDVLRGFNAHNSAMPEVVAYGKAQYDFRDEPFWELVDHSYVRSRTGGYAHVLVHLYECLRHLVRREFEGDVVEFGVYKGGTAIFMAKCLKRWGSKATVFGFDTFAGFPAKRSVLDTYRCEGDEFTDFDVVRANCALEGNIELVKGDISVTYRQLEGRPLMLSFFDTDNYSATRAALPMCADQTVPGGVIAFDHYYSPDWPSPLGERMAAQEVLLERGWLNLHGTGVFLNV